MNPGINLADLGQKMSKRFEELKFSSEFPNLKIVAKGSGRITFTDSFGSETVRLAEYKLDTEPLAFIYCDIYDPVGGDDYLKVPLPYLNRNAGGTALASYLYTATEEYTDLTVATSGGDTLIHGVDYNYVIMYEGEKYV